MQYQTIKTLTDMYLYTAIREGRRDYSGVEHIIHQPLPDEVRVDKYGRTMKTDKMKQLYVLTHPLYPLSKTWDDANKHVPIHPDVLSSPLTVRNVKLPGNPQRFYDCSYNVDGVQYNRTLMDKSPEPTSFLTDEVSPTEQGIKFYTLQGNNIHIHATRPENRVTIILRPIKASLAETIKNHKKENEHANA